MGSDSERMVADYRPVDSGHDERCESEFVHGPMAWSPCDCAERAGQSQKGDDR